MQKTDLKTSEWGKSHAQGSTSDVQQDGKATMSRHGVVYLAAGLLTPHPVIQFSPSSPAKDCLETASRAEAAHQLSAINRRK